MCSDEHTLVNVRDDDLGALVGEESRRLGSNALSAASDNGYLACKHTLGVVEVAGDLGHAVAHDDGSAAVGMLSAPRMGIKYVNEYEMAFLTQASIHPVMWQR